MKKKEIWEKIEKKFSKIKRISPSEWAKNYKPFPLPGERRIKRPKCRFCGGPTRALNNNGIIGPGYSEWNYACEHCGKIQ